MSIISLDTHTQNTNTKTGSKLRHEKFGLHSRVLGSSFQIKQWVYVMNDILMPLLRTVREHQEKQSQRRMITRVKIWDVRPVVAY